LSILIVEQEVHIGDLSLTFNGRDLTKTIEKYVREGFVVFEKPWVKLTEAGYLALTNPYTRRIPWLLVESGEDLRKYGFTKICGNYQISPFNRLILERVEEKCSTIIVCYTGLGEKWREEWCSRRPFKKFLQALHYYCKALEYFEKGRVEAGYPQLLKSLKLARESLNQVNVRKGYPSLGRFFRSDAKKVYKYLTEVRDELTRRVKLPPHLLWEDNSCVKW